VGGRKNVSVKPVFDLIAHRYLTNSNDAIPYERFISAQAFEDTVKYFMEDKRISALCIGCHGSDKELNLLQGAPTS